MGARSRFSQRQTARGLARTCAAVSIVFAIASLGFALHRATITGDFRSVISHQTLTPFLTTAFAVIGVLAVSRHPRNPIGWIFVAVGALYALLGLMAVLISYGPTSSAAYSWASWFGSWLWIPAIFLPTTFVMLIFPDGHLPSSTMASGGLVDRYRARAHRPRADVSSRSADGLGSAGEPPGYSGSYPGPGCPTGRGHGAPCYWIAGFFGRFLRALSPVGRRGAGADEVAGLRPCGEFAWLPPELGDLVLLAGQPMEDRDQYHGE